jgi:HK97 family phage portal protein
VPSFITLNYRGDILAFWKRSKKRDTENIGPDDVLLKALINNEAITREKAMTIPAVSGAVDFISGSIACMPVKLYKYENGTVVEQKGDRRCKLLNSDTGDTLDAFQMKKAIVEDYLMGKGGYAYIQRSRNDVTGIFYVQDIYVVIMKMYYPIFKQFWIDVEGARYEPYEFLKILRNTKDGASGIGITVEVSKALETAYQTLLYQLGLVKKGGNKRGFLKSQRKLGQDEIDILKAAWQNLYSNNEEAVVVLNNGLEFQEASNTSVEMQLNESKKAFLDEINSIFHIYPDDFERTFKEAIYPVVKAFETALNRDLLLEKEKDDYFFSFDVKEIIKASIKERYEAYKTAKETGFLTINEIRAEENLNYVEGLDVVNVGLGAVLYDINTHTYYTPNINQQTDLNKTESMLEGHVMEQEFVADGNSSDA